MTWSDAARAKSKRERLISCRDCGVEVVARSPRRFLCTECRVERQNKRNRERPQYIRKPVEVPPPLVQTWKRLPKEWRVDNAPLTELDQLLKEAEGTSDCYNCKFFVMCRRNVANLGYRLPCFVGEREKVSM